MAYIRKRGTSWYAEIQMRGIRKGESFPTKGEAQAWAAETERVIRAGKSPATSKLLGDAITRYLETVSPKRKDGGAWETRRGLWLCREPIAQTRLDMLTPEVLADWRDARLKQVSSSTVRRDFNFISAILTIARKEWRWISTNPCADVGRTPDNPSRKRRVSDTELALLYHVAGTDPSLIQARAILCFEFCIETAARSSEALSIVPEHINGATVHFPSTKNGHARTVPLSPRAQHILKIVGGQFNLSNSARDANFRKMRAKAGLPDLHFHDSRHEAICRLAQVFDVLDLARISGHRNINELLTYYHADAHTLAAKLLANSRPTLKSVA